MRHRLVIYLWIACWPVLIIIAWNPMRTHATRAAMILCAAGIVAGMVIAVWKRVKLRYVVLAILLLGAIFLLLPARRIDATALRAAYVGHLLAYRNVPYVWGGENGRGVDCSGLVRAGLIDAEVGKGLATWNPGLLRDAANLWWFKCNAKWLRDGYRQQTRLLLVTPALRSLDDTALLPGDFAVTDDGTHTLAYLGGGTWIQADPDSMHVMTMDAHRDNNGYLRTAMHVMRWRGLEQ